MQKKLRMFIEKHQMIRENDRVIAGVSGGADSMCLFWNLLELKRELSFEFAVVHVNHMLRGQEADDDESFVKTCCAAQGVVCKVYSFPVEDIAKQEKLSLEEAGRKMRYHAFEAFAQEWGADKIALAHHQNDLAETMLYHMARGTGIGGLGSLRPVRNSVIRPLLCMNREEIEQYLEDRQLSYRTDRTNLEMDYTRNKIRHQVLPALSTGINEKTVEHMASLAEDVEEIQDYLQEVTERLCSCLVRREANRLILSGDILREKPLFQRCVVQRCLERAAGTRKDFTRVHIMDVLELFQKESGKSLNLPYDIMVSHTYGELWFEKRKAQKEHEWAMQKIDRSGAVQYGEYRLECEIIEKDEKRIPQKSYTKWIDYDKINTVLTVRTRLPGDYIVINENGGRKKLKDYFIDNKIPREKRDRIVLIADGSEIVWIVGYRLSHRYMIRENTRKILQLGIKGGDVHGG